MPALMQRKYSFSIDISPFRIFRALAGPHMAQLTTVSVSTLHAGVNDRMCDFLGIPVNGVSVFQMLRDYGCRIGMFACNCVNRARRVASLAGTLRQPCTPGGGQGRGSLPGGEAGCALLQFDRFVETAGFGVGRGKGGEQHRSEEHTSELQSP